MSAALPSGRQAQRAAEACVALALLLLFALSANMLQWLGVPYTQDGGPFWVKLHPGNALLILAAALAVMWPPAASPPPSRAGGGPHGRLACGVAVLCLLLLVALSVLVHGAENVIVLADTYLPACCAALVLQASRADARAALGRLLALLLALNAALALGEGLAGANLVPLFMAGSDTPYLTDAAEFRATGLADHPLSGALLAMCGTRMAPSGPGRAALLLAPLCWLALLAFGGRAALAGSLVLALLRARHGGWRWLQACFARPDARVLLGGIALAVMLPLTLLLVATRDGGMIGTRLVQHMGWDDSAAARMQVLGIFADIPADMLLFGLPRGVLIALLEPARLQFGASVLENSYALVLLTTGLVGMALFLAGMAALLLGLRGIAPGGGAVLVWAVLIVAATSNVLGRKSPVLTFAVIAACVSRPDRGWPARAPRWRKAGHGA